ncbi:hypothetical protein DS742_24845 [Lacrimispora amygdalina]|uniref:Uncharacterized protein n=1 Tax=Lacrimispora amygdalina TaxID=253257 RepID=A0A3E2N5H2_9FIRM|nr:hypothetical protein DS742_24845 [Clostridium indicum]
MYLFCEQGRQHFLLLPLDCLTAETGELVNGGRSPFISTVDMGGRLCYVVTKQGDQLFTVDRLWLSHYLVFFRSIRCRFFGYHLIGRLDFINN